MVMKAITVAEVWLKNNASGRECGKCIACCIYLGIEELQKYSAEKCKHLRSSVYGTKRCGIYASRPVACSEYKCMWLAGFGPDYMRPIESGILVTSYDSDISGKVSFTVNVFDMKKADGKINELIAALFAIPNTDEVRLINIAEKTALLFKNGKIYRCRLLPSEGYENLMFEAYDPPIGNYLQQELN